MSFNIVSLLCTETNPTMSGELGMLLDNPNKVEYDYINLKSKFEFIYDQGINPLNEMLCKNILNTIKLTIKKEKNLVKLPKDMFSDKMVMFAISYGVFFEEDQANFSKYNYCNLLMMDENHFSIKYIEEYHNLFMLHSSRLYNYLNSMLMAYVVLTNSESEIIYNYCNILSEAYNIASTIEHKKEIMTSGYKLFVLFYSGISNMVHIDTNTIDIYKSAYQTIVINNSKYLISLTEHKTKYIHMINNLNLNNRFAKHLSRFMEGVDLDKVSTFIDIVNILPCMLVKDTYIGDEPYTMFIDKIKPKVIKMLSSESIHIEHKAEIVCRFENFFGKEHMSILTKIFLDLEQQTHSTQKIKFRSNILKVLKDIYDTNYPLEMDNFISIYVQHITDILENIVVAMNNFRNVSNNMNKLLIVKYILYLQTSILLLDNLYDSGNHNDLFYFKLLEMFYSFLKISQKNNLYSQLSMFYSEQDISFIPKGFTHTLDKVFSNMYVILNKLTHNNEFINILMDNQYFYDRNIIDKIKATFGNFIVETSVVESEKVLTIHTILSNLEKELLEYINTFERSKPKYTCEIPDEFKDPILLNNIKVPIEIPGAKQIVDKYTIYNHLFFNRTNPFTNEALTIEELDNYNCLPGVKERLAHFSEKLLKWQKDHLI